MMLLAALAAGGDAASCGSINVLSRMYLYGNPISKAQALEWLAGGKCGKPDMVMLSYRGAASDKALLAVLGDLVAKGRDLPIAANIFFTYRCLPGAEFEPGYARIHKALASQARRGQHCPAARARRGWLTVTRDETLYRIPNARSPVTGLVRKGNVVTPSGRAGGWMRVSTWRGETGWMARDSLVPYGAR
jgi:Bacterial SH3 domain